MRRHILPVIITLACFTSFSHAAPTTAPAISLDPGYQTNLPLPGSTANQTCELYVPRTPQKANTSRPVLFVLGKSTSTTSKWINAMGLTTWAEENGVIIIGVNQLFVATPPATTAPVKKTTIPTIPTEEAMDAYMSFADSLPGIHRNIRLVVADDTGITGQFRTLAVAQRYPNQIAGLALGPQLYPRLYENTPPIQLGAGTGVAIVAVSWEAYAKSHPTKPYIIGTDDPFGYTKFESTIGDALRLARTPLNYCDTDDFAALKPDRLHAGLSWLLANAWLSKPGVTKDELASAKAAIQSQLKKAAAESDAALRESHLRDLLLITNVPTNDGKSYLTSWRQSVLPAAETRTHVLFKYLYLKKAADLPLMKGSPEAAQLNAKIKALEADPIAQKEIDGEKQLRALTPQVATLGIDGKTVDKATQLQTDFQNLIADFPDTLAAREAKDWSDLLDRRIKSISNRPGRPKTR